MIASAKASEGFRIKALNALEILDSRGSPTLEVSVELDGGAKAKAGVPSGASTGQNEAVERRDEHPSRFLGRGVISVVSAVEGEIARGVTHNRWKSLAELDEALCALDGTPNKRRLGANAIVGVSLAVARALAAQGD